MVKLGMFVTGISIVCAVFADCTFVDHLHFALSVDGNGVSQLGAENAFACLLGQSKATR